MKTKIKLLVLSLLTLLAFCSHAQGLNLKLNWNGPVGWQTNGATFNIRGFAAGSVLTNYNTWPVVRIVVNTNTTTFTNVSATQFFAILVRLPNGETSYYCGPVTAQYVRQ